VAGSLEAGRPGDDLAGEDPGAGYARLRLHEQAAVVVDSLLHDRCDVERMALAMSAGPGGARLAGALIGIEFERPPRSS
jgi:hypothetical protein